jgi:hypothetical protein
MAAPVLAIMYTSGMRHPLVFQNLDQNNTPSVKWLPFHHVFSFSFKILWNTSISPHGTTNSYFLVIHFYTVLQCYKNCPDKCSYGDPYYFSKLKELSSHWLYVSACCAYIYTDWQYKPKYKVTLNVWWPPYFSYDKTEYAGSEGCKHKEVKTTLLRNNAFEI